MNYAVIIDRDSGNLKRREAMKKRKIKRIVLSLMCVAFTLVNAGENGKEKGFSVENLPANRGFGGS